MKNAVHMGLISIYLFLNLVFISSYLIIEKLLQILHFIYLNMFPRTRHLIISISISNNNQEC